tara:strand:- start:20213 stop:20419 length:207 start_codon:yes stop_codon:yes gene_type:complete
MAKQTDYMAGVIESEAIIKTKGLASAEVSLNDFYILGGGGGVNMIDFINGFKSAIEHYKSLINNKIDF